MPVKKKPIRKNFKKPWRATVMAFLVASAACLVVVMLAWFGSFIIFNKSCGTMMSGDAIADYCGYGRGRVCKSVIGIKRLSHCRTDEKYLKHFNSPKILPENSTAKSMVSSGSPKTPAWLFRCNTDSPYYDADLNKCVADCGEKISIDNFPGFPNRRCVSKQ